MIFKELEKRMAEAEYYFIQLLFCENRMMLTVKMRPVFDALFKKYEEIYADGRERHMDLSEINNKFMQRIK